MSSRVRILMLGQLRLFVGDNDVARFRTYKTGALLGYLGYHIGKPVPREELIEMLWPDTLPDQARNSLSQSLSSLRHLLEPGTEDAGRAVEAGRHTIRLLSSQCATDVDDFRALSKIASQAHRRGEMDLWETKAQEAVALFLGEFLPGIYEDWTMAPREHLREEVLGLLDALVDVTRQRGQLREALNLSLQAITIEPTREASHRSAISFYDELGEPEASLRQYRELERALGNQLGLKPSQETKTLVKESLRRERSDVREIPAVPESLTRFFGRESEVAGVASLISGEQSRLVTVTGPGGMGKTRLTLEAARSIAQSFDGGSTFVALEAARDGNEVWAGIASARDLTPASNQPVRNLVLSALARGRQLVVLDNFEQLCDNGGPVVVKEILQARKNVSILVSSRRRLGIEGEVEVALHPLTEPDTLDLVAAAANPSVALFLDRARNARPDFTLTDAIVDSVVSLCRQLEGIPLALELAAARIPVLSPAQMLDRFADRLDLLSTKSKAERHQSLRRAIDWSYHSLPDHLQHAFRCLSLFRGGWSEEAAEAVLDSPTTLDLLAELRDFSLIGSRELPSGAIRFFMLETLREYALQLFTQEELLQLRTQYLSAFRRLMEDADRSIEGPQQVRVLEAVRADLDNIRQSIEWAVVVGDAESALALCSASWRCWHLLAYLAGGTELCRKVLALAGGSPELRARVLNGLGRLEYVQGNFAAAEASHCAARDLQSDDERVMASTLYGLATVHYARGEYEQALDSFEEALTTRRSLHDDYGSGAILHWFGIVYTELGRLDEAKVSLEESLELRQRIGDVSGMARSYNSLGLVEQRSGRRESARDYYEKALKEQRKLGTRDHSAISALLVNLASVAYSLGDSSQSLELVAEAEKMSSEAGIRAGLASAHHLHARILLSTDNHAAARFCADALKGYFEMDNQWGIAACLETSAASLLRTGSYSLAATALGVAAKIGSAEIDSLSHELKERLGGEAFDQCRRDGQEKEAAVAIREVLRALADYEKHDGEDSEKIEAP